MKGYPAEIILDLIQAEVLKIAHNRFEPIWVFGDRQIPDVNMNFESQEDSTNRSAT
jgi:hypothetical protein